MIEIIDVLYNMKWIFNLFVGCTSLNPIFLYTETIVNGHALTPDMLF